MNHRYRKSSSSRLLNNQVSRFGRHLKLYLLLAVGFLMSCGLVLGLSSTLVQASGESASPRVSETAPATPNSDNSSTTQEKSNSTVVLPEAIDAPVLKPLPTSTYILEFNRSPIVGNRLRLEGIYNEARLQFTRPRHWKPESVKVLLKFRHSGALFASRSNLTLLVNGTSVGSIPMNKRQAEIASVVFDVPTDLLQDYNEVVVAALQNNSPTCTQDPFDPSLWSEILPDSKIVFEFQPQSVPLAFNQYPYPIFDTLSLESNPIAYLMPETVDESWLTATARLQTSLGRLAEYRVMDSRTVTAVSQVKEAERLVVIGTPASQPSLSSFQVPLSIEDTQWLDDQGNPIPDDVGVLMLATTAADKVPVLIATGNSSDAVAKATQFLVNSQDRQIGTGSVILVNQVNPVVSPPVRQWEGYLPLQDSFQLSDLKAYSKQPYDDITVWGSHAPALEVNFRALPDDHFLPGSTMTLVYSYGPQINPLTSLVEISLDGIALGGKRLSSVDGGDRERLTVNLPADRIKPSSKIRINFRLDPRERRSCSRVTDQQLWGTIHADTSFELNREAITRIPDLHLLQFGYPFAEPQDLSRTTIALPDQPSQTEVDLMLEITERLGRISKADAVQLNAYRVNELPSEERRDRHLIAIGNRAKFPFPDLIQQDDLVLGGQFSRQWQQSQVQTSPDQDGVVREVLSPWNKDRVVLLLSAQTDAGLRQVRDLISIDSLFYQLQEDTVLIGTNPATLSPDRSNHYTLTFLQQARQRELTQTRSPKQWVRILFRNWFILVPGMLVATLLLYAVAQVQLKRLEDIKQKAWHQDNEPPVRDEG